MSKKNVFLFAGMFIYTVTISILFLCIGFVFGTNLAAARSPSSSQEFAQFVPVSDLETSAEVVPSPPPAENKPRFLLKELDGKIGVYENNNLIRIIDVDITTLRRQDQLDLKEGINIGTEQELAEAIEDYIS